MPHDTLTHQRWKYWAPKRYSPSLQTYNAHINKLEDRGEEYNVTMLCLELLF